jgi:hypothetical protein
MSHVYFPFKIGGRVGRCGVSIWISIRFATQSYSTTATHVSRPDVGFILVDMETIFVLVADVEKLSMQSKLWRAI